MAQWNGQFTGNTHATKIEDLEETLVQAVSAFRTVSSDAESGSKGKAVRKLAEKLLSARLKFLKARLNDAEPVTEENIKKQISQVENLRHQEAQMRLEGISGVLAEFDAPDLDDTEIASKLVNG